MDNIVIKANNIGVVQAISSFLTELAVKAYYCKWMTIDFEQLTFTMNGVNMSYDKALDYLKGIEALSWVKQYHSGYFTSHSNALEQYHEIEKHRQLEQDEASFEHAAKEAGYDKDLYPDGRDFEEAKPGLGGTTFTVEFNKEWLKPKDDDEDFINEVNDILKS